jgi:hypothetical protein
LAAPRQIGQFRQRQPGQRQIAAGGVHRGQHRQRIADPVPPGHADLEGQPMITHPRRHA